MQELPIENEEYDYDDIESSPRIFIIIITVIIGLLVAVIGIIVFISSPPADTSIINITYEQNSGVVRLFHEGGESVPLSSMEFHLSGHLISPSSVSIEGGGSDFAIGKTIKIETGEQVGLLEVFVKKEDKELPVSSFTIISSLPTETKKIENLTITVKPTKFNSTFNSTPTPVTEITTLYTLYAVETGEGPIYHILPTVTRVITVPTTIPPMKTSQITYSPKNGNAPLTVQFTSNAAVNDNVLWDFGDGESGTEFNPVHIFKSPGLYSVRFTLADPYGRKDTIVYSDAIEVLPYALTDVFITGESGSYLKKGGLLSFRVIGEGSSVKIGGRIVKLNPDDEVDLNLIEDEFGSIKIKGTTIAGFSFPNIRMCISDKGCAQGIISDVYVPNSRLRLSTLSLILPPGVKYDGRINTTTITGISLNLTFFSLKPDTSGDMVLESKEGSRLYYKGGAGDIRGQ